jgi:hypothetical protein
MVGKKNVMIAMETESESYLVVGQRRAFPPGCVEL